VNGRDFITLLDGAAVTWLLAARAQQLTMPVIGLLDQSRLTRRRAVLRGFR
jgi:putative tryptophan/tyrosine transport system substrate-binding protein